MQALEAAGIRANGAYGGEMRLGKHWQIDREAIDRKVAVIRSVVDGSSGETTAIGSARRSLTAEY